MILAAFILAGALAGSLLAAALMNDGGASKDGGGETISWNLTGMGGANSAADQHHPFDATQTQDMTAFEVHVEQWPIEQSPGDEWLSQSIEYAADAVTITLRVRDAYRAPVAGQPAIGRYDTGGWVAVQLREPLRSRALVDGTTGKAVPYPSAH